MPTTTVRNIDLILVGSFGKEVLASDAFQNLSLGMSGPITIPLSATDHTLTTDNQGEAMHMILILTGALTANVNLIVPDEGRVFVVDNRTTGAFLVTVTTLLGGGIAVPQGDRTFVSCDGTNVFPVGTSGGGGGGDGAPVDASYLVSAAHSLLTGERVVTNTSTLTWDHSTAGQSQANVPSASTETAGVIELATEAETQEGVDATRAITPATLNARIAAGGAETQQGIWEWTTQTSGAPSQGQIGVNASQLAVVTEVRLSHVTSNNTDVSALLAAKSAGDGVIIQDRNDSTRFGRYTLTAAGLDQGDWTRFPVLFVSQGTNPFNNNQEVVVVFVFSTPLPAASETQAGIVELATAAEVSTGTDPVRAVTPATLVSRQGTETMTGLLQLATVAEAQGGSNTTKAVHAAGMNAAITAASGTRQPLDATLSALAGLTTAANTLAYFTGVDTATTTPLTAFARTLIDDADASAARTTLGITSSTPGGANTQVQYNSNGSFAGSNGLLLDGGSVTSLNLASPLSLTQGGTGATSAATARSNLGLVIGSTVQGQDATLSALAGLSTAGNALPYFTGIDAATTTTLTAFGRTLLDDVNAQEAQASLGLGTLATLSTVGTTQLTNAAVTYAKLQNVSTNDRLLGRATAGAGNVEELTIGSGLLLTGTTLSAPPPAISGTPFSVARYAASGTALEATPLTIDASGALTVVTTNVQPITTWSAEHTTTTGGLVVEVYQPGSGSGSFTFRKAVGTRAAPGRVTGVGNGAGNVTGAVWARNATDTADDWQFLGRLNVIVDSIDAQGRVGGALAVMTAPGGSAAMTEVARFTGTGGNLLLGATTHGTNATATLAIGPGVAPTTSPADTVQLWEADTNGVAAKGGLHLRTEDGTGHVFGDRVGLGTLTPETTTQHTITAPLNAVPLMVSSLVGAASNRAPVTYLTRRTTTDMVDNFGVALSLQIADNAGVDNQIALIVAKRQGADNSGRMLLLSANAGVTAGNTAPGDLAIDPVGNVSLNVDVFANGGQRVLALGSGVAPATSPGDAVQMWSADVGGVAGTAALHIRDEGGRITTIGNGILSKQAQSTVNAATLAAPYLLTVDESGKLLIANNSAEMVQMTLPSASAGYIYLIMNNLATGVRIRAGAGDWIRFGATQGATAGYIQTTIIGDTITLIAINSIAWQMIGPAQGWTAGA